MRLAIGIATTGRPVVLAEALRQLEWQTRQPDRVIVCHANAADVIGIAHKPDRDLLRAPAGTCVQRNAVLDAANDCDIVVFFDDDFLPDPRYLQVTETAFLQNPDVVVTTGDLLADGINGPGLTIAAARRLLAAGDEASGSERPAQPVYSGYGCNMALRLDTLRRHAMRFDERLPLYGWYEDLDLTRRLGRYGCILRLPAAKGVHLGVKSGRTSGARLGYSQVANPIYLWRKGTYDGNRALASICRNVTANVVKSPWPERWVDRRGRLRGNLRAVFDLLCGHLTPERILEF